MTRKTLRLPIDRHTGREHRLGFGNLDQTGRRLDVAERFDEETGGERFEIVLPRLTLGAVSDYAADLLTPALEKRADRNPYEVAPDDIAEEFQQSDGYHEWAASFEPLMNIVWPLFLADTFPGFSAEEVATRFNQFGGAVTLLSFGSDSELCSEEYGIGLTGGGMNLSDHLAAAYLCAGSVPPYALLTALPGVLERHRAEECGRLLKQAYRLAAGAFADRAKRVREDARRAFRPEWKQPRG